jgi:hypothetical protein
MQSLSQSKNTPATLYWFQGVREWSERTLEGNWLQIREDVVVALARRGLGLAADRYGRYRNRLQAFVGIGLLLHHPKSRLAEWFGDYNWPPVLRAAKTLQPPPTQRGSGFKGTVL